MNGDRDLSWSTSVSALTHKGLLRGSNEDAVAVNDVLLSGASSKLSEGKLGSAVLMIADGMGGHTNGELASRFAIEYLLKRINSVCDLIFCADALSGVNDYLYDLMSERPEVLGLGTTVVGVALDELRLLYFNVGDSRVYRHSRGKLSLLSHDDVPSETIENNGRRASHQITQSLGGRLRRTAILPHIKAAPALHPGESILLCSDGLTDMASDSEICKVLDEPGCPREVAEKLLQLALNGGGQDNISIVVAHFHSL